MTTTNGTLAAREATPGIPRIADDGRDVILEPCRKRIRVFFDGELIADTTDARILFERGHTPVYYFPAEDVLHGALVESDKQYHCPRKGDARFWTVDAGGRLAEDAVWNYPDPIEDCPPIGDLLAFEWDQMDAWFEEDEEVFVHARNPYTRIDVLESSRHVVVRVDSAVVAESDRPVLLFETGLPVRYYLPKTDVRLDLLRPSDTVTRCPYKGIANRYWTIETPKGRLEDAAWSYDHPTSEASGIAGRIAFYSERAAVYVDGLRVTHE